jgi:5-amino-6-(5-phospho-D-ribitylamino)uracil phosphatase
LDTCKPLPIDPPRLVAIDLDGTLLRDDQTISDANIAAIREAVSLGVRIVLATGRPPRTVGPTYQKLGLTTVEVNHNGALIFDRPAGKVLYHQPLPAATARAVVKLAQGVDPRLAVGAEVIDRLFTARRKNSEAIERDPAMKPQTDTAALDEALQGPVTKLLFLGQSDVLGEIQMRMGQDMAKHVAVAFTHQRLLQVVAAGVNKATALAKVARHYGVTQEQVMAIGDAPNDREMLAWAGRGVVLENGWPDVRRLADFTAPGNNDDGVAEALRRHVIEPLRMRGT